MLRETIRFWAAPGFLLATSAGCHAEKPANELRTSSNRQADVTYVFRKFDDCSSLSIHPASFCQALTSPPEALLTYATIDVDGDQIMDRVVRKQSVNECGSHGCSTYVLLKRGAAFIQANPPLVTYGPVQPCRDRNRAGIRFPEAGAAAPCLTFSLTQQ